MCCIFSVYKRHNGVVAAGAIMFLACPSYVTHAPVILISMKFVVSNHQGVSHTPLKGCVTPSFRTTPPSPASGGKEGEKGREGGGKEEEKGREGTPKGWLTPPCSKSWKISWLSLYRQEIKWLHFWQNCNREKGPGYDIIFKSMSVGVATSWNVVATPSKWIHKVQSTWFACYVNASMETIYSG